MNFNSQELTDIQRFYKNSTVLLSGATGFIGKLFLEKVLRSLPVKKVFILVREKKEVSAIKRFQEIFEAPIFEVIKRSNPELINKVSILVGDCAALNLGLSAEDRTICINEVDVFFHCAATVRFDQHIAQATFTNVRATRDLIGLAKQIQNLKTFVYVGTGYSNCNQSEIEEKIYKPRISAEKLIAACESLDTESLDVMTPTLLGDWPNTYTFTKQVVEDYIDRECRGIPICITRPTVVISTESEPISAYVDNVFTLAGFVLGNAMGITRISYYKNTLLDIVPADYVVNECIAAGWQTGENFKPYTREIPIYNISSSGANPITQDELYESIDRKAREIPSPKIILYPIYFRTTCKYNYLFFRFFFHTLLAHFIDFALKIQGKKPQFVKGVEKLHKFQESYEYFSTKDFFYHTENTQRILKKMSYNDKQLFNFDITKLTWETYFSNYIRGLRVYLLNDPMSTVPEGKVRIRKLRNYLILSLVGIVVFMYIFVRIAFCKVLPLAFGFVMYLLRSAIC